MFRKIAIATALLSVASNSSLAKSAAKSFSCYGDYANVFTNPESGDLLGLELVISRPDKVELFAYEGAKTAAQATNISIVKNEISLDYHGTKFHGVCRRDGIHYSGIDWETGKPSNDLVLRRK